MIRTDPEQGNLIDGTVVAYDPCEDGAYVTFAGLDGLVIASIDAEDLALLGGPIHQAVNTFNPDVPQEDRTRITERGIEFLRALVAPAAAGPDLSPKQPDRFSLYCEPTALLDAARDVIVGLGELDGAEYAYIGAGGTEIGYGEVLLTREQLGRLIDTLSETFGAMETDS